MVGTIVLSPTGEACQKPVIDSAQRVVLARAHGLCEYLDSLHAEFELVGSARSVVMFDCVLP